jgi:pumilio RNA-binding family
MSNREVVARVIELACDQQGSRLIQMRLDASGRYTGSHQNPDDIFGAAFVTALHEMVLPCLAELVVSPFANYTVQKLMVLGTQEQRNELAGWLRGRVVDMSFHLYGCRVVQRALDVASLELQSQLAAEFEPAVLRCVRDCNANHCIQKVIERVPPHRLQFVVDALMDAGVIIEMATHTFGCRVVQRLLEHGTSDQTRPLLVELVQAVPALSQDPYANYVIQHVLKHGRAEHRTTVIDRLRGQYVLCAQHKFASNVIEKAIEHGSATEREQIIDELLGADADGWGFLSIMKHRYGNFVASKCFSFANSRQKVRIQALVEQNLDALLSFTFSKHLARIICPPLSPARPAQRKGR